ncbi:MAG: AzlD domain-containing protein [Gracilibacteraceae bacterium]|jgi:branched-subunit amino acid transport protein AzlD|nr:AzlD domain-containing protein [Gracilibacteraceae bacterium]
MDHKTLAAAVIIIALVTLGTRAFPFLVFRSGQTPPALVLYIGRCLPPAVITIIVVYCYRNLDFTAPQTALPQLAAGAAVVLLHLWRHNFLLSILGGTAFYLLLLRVF